ncbi:MAG: 7-carboxy-7-deazaguanine synthase QueE [Sulfolobaceae archaeon]|nr:7-carboxy-7-deazaguanine synthase QueE [Stygiolobus sp.]MDT7875153.1 7-carboxy-7-deazaguanine synthase QueE [Sulfolobaceae archaeon]PVU68119.1 radical SAM protein [Sulfolobus sp. SCGC AB-777_G05]
MFTSIQGEGEVIGTPSNFIRLAGCHLRCIWCDTKYAWHKYEGKLMDLEDIIAVLDKDIKMTTITGGEPLLQDILPLVEKLKEIGERIVVETSGTIKPSEKLIKLVDVFSVSPKLSNSGYKINYGDLSWATYFKFVVVKKEDIEEVVEFVKNHKIPPEKVILQPDGRRSDYINALRELSDFVMELKLPFRVLPQLHRIITYR